MSKAIARLFVCLLFTLIVTLGLQTAGFAQTPLAPGSIQVSRVQYDGNTVPPDGYDHTFPNIFNDPNVSGIQGSIWIDQFTSVPFSASAGTLSLPSSGTPYITTSFSSKSEGALMLSPSGSYLTYMGYLGQDQTENVSNSYSNYCPADLNPPGSGPFYDRAVALIGTNGLVGVTDEENAFSGDNPRAAVTADGNEFYMAGNSDSTEYTASQSKPICGQTQGTFGPGLTIGARYDGPLSGEQQGGPDLSNQLGIYFAADRPDESSKQHVKDNNFRGIGIYTDADGNQNLYVSKGSGGNGDDGVFWVQNGTGPGLPTGSTNTIVELLGAPATNPQTQAASPYTPFGFWFANPTTLYLADEGYANTDQNGNLIPDPLAGLQKWSLVNGTWTLDYTISAGLNLYQPQTVAGYPVPTYTYGIRNLAGWNNGDGSVTIYAITSQYSTVSGGEPDPTSLVGITDSLAATSLPANEQFVTLQTSASQEVYRGVAYIPPAQGTSRQTQTINFPAIGTQTYPVAPITLTASANSGWPIVFSVVSGPATISGNVLTITGAGSVVIEADQSGNTDYTPATVQQTVTVNQASQTISFSVNAPAQATYGTSFTVAASATSGLPITYTSAGSCSNVGSTYTMTSGTGTCTVTATQPGNSDYLAASPVSQFTAAMRANQTVTFTGAPAQAAYGTSFVMIATTNASSVAYITTNNPNTCSLSGPYSPVTVTMLKSTGKCTFTASWGADQNYNPATATQTTAAEKAAPVITWPTPSAIYYGTPLSSTQLDATANVDGSFTYSPAAGKILPVGGNTLNATFKPSDSNYGTATATVSLQVLPAATTTTITSSSETIVLNGKGIADAILDFNVTSYKPTGTVTLTATTGEVCTGNVSANTGNGSCKLTFTTVGTRTISATYSGDGNHKGSNNSGQNPPVTVTVNTQ